MGWLARVWRCAFVVHITVCGTFTEGLRESSVAVSSQAAFCVGCSAV